MARIYQSKEILPGNFALQISQAYQNREKTNRELRNDIAKGLGEMAIAAGQGIDKYVRYKKFSKNGIEQQIKKLQDRKAELEAERDRINSQLSELTSGEVDNEKVDMNKLWATDEQSNEDIWNDEKNNNNIWNDNIMNITG